MGGIVTGHGIPALLEAVTKLLPLDAYVPKPVSTSCSQCVLHGCRASQHGSSSVGLCSTVGDADGPGSRGQGTWTGDSSLDRVQENCSRGREKRGMYVAPPPPSLPYYPSPSQVNVELIERFAFYERAKQAFAVVATG